MIVALLVILVLAVVVRFARAAGSDAVAGIRTPAPISPSTSDAQIDASHVSPLTMGLLP
jgi:hypothetical protein